MKKDQRGFTHNVALLVLSVFVFAAIGFAGLRVYQYKSSDNAKAAGYGKTIFQQGSNTGGWVYGFICKNYIPSTNSYQGVITVRNGTKRNITRGSVKLASTTVSYTLGAGFTKRIPITAPSGALGANTGVSAYYADNTGSSGEGYNYFANAPSNNPAMPYC